MSSSGKTFEFSENLSAFDSEVQDLLDIEHERQDRRIILIASESICPAPVREALSCKFSNIYAEGYPCWRMTEGGDKNPLDYTRHLSYYRRYSDLRYYKGADYANFIEALAQRRLASLFATPEFPAEKIFANVQPLSGAAANNAVYNAFCKAGDTVLGLDLVQGGHLTHGSPANRSGVFHNVIPYGIKRDGQLDYESMEKLAREHKPKLIVVGASAYPMKIDFARVRGIADEVGAIMLADIAHPAGLVAAGQFPNPVGHAHVVSFTTHKTLCGPRGAALLSTDQAIAAKVNLGVFPGEQGGPHVNQIAAKAVAFKMAASNEYKEMMARVVENARAMGEAFKEEGFKLVYGGTESHLFLLDLKAAKYNATPRGCCLKGEVASRLLELVGIVTNKNTIPGDTNAAHPTALRFGTTWVTQVGFGVPEVRELAGIISRLLKGCHTFQYMENSGYVGRAKVDIELIRRSGKEVEALFNRVEGKGRVYPHFEAFPAATGKEPEIGEVPATGKTAVLGDAGVLEVWSERAHYFAQSIGTANTAKLGEWEATTTLLLDQDGGLIDDVQVLRIPDETPGWRRYLFLTAPERHESVRSWLRAVSDGYVLFDDEVHRKVEGPVMVADLTDEGPTNGGDEWNVLGLYGPEAKQVLVDLKLDPPGPGRLVPLKGDGGGLVMAPRHGEDRFLLMGPAPLLAKYAAQVKNQGDAGVRAAWRTVTGLPLYQSGEQVDLDALHRKFPEMVDTQKVYFAGQAKFKATEKGLPHHQWQETECELKRTPLYDTHAKLTKKKNLVPFAGWEMPVIYTSIEEEHQAVRQTCGLFDVSHMGVVDIRGQHAQRFLDAITSNYVAWLRDGQGHYSYLLDIDGKVLDDILVYRISWDNYMMVVNAANEDKDIAHLQAMASGKYCLNEQYPGKLPELPVEIRSLKDASAGADMRVDLALQGPRAFDIMRAATDNPAMIDQLEQLGRFEFVNGELIAGLNVYIARTGYTGEDKGVEFYVHPDNLVQLWDLLMKAGAPFGITPAGLGARDSTRTEAGFPLYGHELAGEWSVDPMEAGYGSAVKFHKPFFIGREKLLARELDASRQIVRFKLPGAAGKSLIRTGHPVVDSRGRYAGVVTSCCVVGAEQIGLALVDKKMAAVGKVLNFYALPAAVKRIPEPIRIDQLAKGDAVLLAQEGIIIPRFM